MIVLLISPVLLNLRVISRDCGKMCSKVDVRASNKMKCTCHEKKEKCTCFVFCRERLVG